MAWSRIPEKEGWTLWLVGDGEERQALETQIEELGIGTSVLLGRAEKDMASVYAKSAILALPSRYEGLPMALIESQAFGIPAVAFDCSCGPREIIVDGETGLLVPEGEIDGLAAGLQRLMQDPELRGKMGQAAFRNAGRWSQDYIMQQWVRLFDEIS